MLCISLLSLLNWAHHPVFYRSVWAQHLFIYLLHIFCHFSFMSLMITFCMDYWFLLDNYNNVYERKHTHKQENICVCVGGWVCACEISACRSEEGIGSLRIGEPDICEPQVFLTTESFPVLESFLKCTRARILHPVLTPITISTSAQDTPSGANSQCHHHSILRWMDVSTSAVTDGESIWWWSV